MDVMSAMKTAIPSLVFSAISDAATTQQEINKIKNKDIRMYHPWSSLTDGGLHDYVDHCVLSGSLASYCSLRILQWHALITS